jgi:putative transposase
MREVWSSEGAWFVGRYILMPDHVHLFCAPRTIEPEPLLPWVKYWKAKASQAWPLPREARIWQRHFWDTQLRRRENYEQKWIYVADNPVRAGLVKNAENWPYQGQLNTIHW